MRKWNTSRLGGRHLNKPVFPCNGGALRELAEPDVLRFLFLLPLFQDVTQVLFFYRTDKVRKNILVPVKIRISVHLFLLSFTIIMKIYRRWKPTNLFVGGTAPFPPFKCLIKWYVCISACIFDRRLNGYRFFVA